jgi:hypothetical protein
MKSYSANSAQRREPKYVSRLHRLLDCCDYLWANILPKALTPEQKTLLNSLPNSNVYESLNNIEAPCPGTTNWILSHPLFTVWMTSTTADILNITGKLGSGKSVLSTDLFNLGLREISKSRLFYFAFRNHSNERSASSAWASLIRQSLTTDIPLISKILKQYEQWRVNTEGLGTSFWTPSRLKEAFQMTLLEYLYRSVYIIDALDQCDSTVENFVNSFSILPTPSGRAKVKLLFLCRQGSASLQLSTNLPNLATLDLDEQSAHEQAIERAVRQQVNNLCGQRGFPELAETIAKSVSEKANGMCLLAFMVMESLSKVHATPRNIMRELLRFPEDLMVTYRNCLDNIEPKHRQLVATILLWVVFATRPLTVKELASAVAFNETVRTPQDLELNTSVGLFGAAGISELHGPFIKLWKFEKITHARLIHHSVKEFLLRTKKDVIRPPDWISRAFTRSQHLPSTTQELHSQANRTLANHCFCYYYLMVCCEKERRESKLLTLDSLWYRSSLTSRWASPFSTLRSFHAGHKQSICDPLDDLDSDIEILEGSTSSQNEDERIYYKIVGKHEQHIQQPMGQESLQLRMIRLKHSKNLYWNRGATLSKQSLTFSSYHTR